MSGGRWSVWTSSRYRCYRKPASHVDYGYQRAGMASMFLFCEPLVGWRAVTVRERRTKLDWVEEVAVLLESRYANCERIRLVLDNLNTHTQGALYEAFEPERARRLRQRIKFQYTPKHTSWLNVAECELSCLTRQCLKGRRIGDLDELRAEVAAWSQRVNASQRGVNWRMSVADARCRLKSLYPKSLLDGTLVRVSPDLQLLSFLT